MRFDDSPDLFGVGHGVSTVGKTRCEFCGAVYHADNEDEKGDVIDPYADPVGETIFAGKTICDCCWEKIEVEILRRMPDILRWYNKILQARRTKLEGAEDLMREIYKTVKGMTTAQ